MTDPAAGDDTLSVLKGLWQLVHVLEVRSKSMQRTMGVTGPQRLVIRIVGGRPGVTAGAIAAELSIHASTLTGILARMERAGLIARRADAEDGRRACFELTAKGRAIHRQRRGTVEDAVRKVVTALPPKLVHQHQLVVRHLVAALDSDD